MWKVKKTKGQTFIINFGKREQLPENKSKSAPPDPILTAQEELHQKVGAVGWDESYESGDC